MTIVQLQEQRNKLMTDAAAILQADTVSPEQRTQSKAMLADVDVLEERIADLRKIEKIQTDDRSFTPSPRPVPGKAAEASPEEQRSKFSEAFRSYARSGWNGMEKEQRDLLTIAPSTGGALIPQMFLPTLFEAQKFAGPIATKVAQKTTDNNGAPMRISFANDTANGLLLLGEAQPVVEADPAFSNKILGVDMVHSGIVKVSFQELDDSAFDLDAWLRKAFGLRDARGIEKAITLGLDVAGNTLPNVQSLISAANVALTTTADANGIQFNDLTSVYGALDPAYLNSPSWVMNSATRAYFLGQKDGFGRPYWQNDPSTSAPFSSILGYPIVLDQAMQSPGPDATPVLFGSLEDAYLFRTDGAPSILRLNERYADTLEVGFFLYRRIGGITINTATPALVAIKMSHT